MIPEKSYTIIALAEVAAEGFQYDVWLALQAKFPKKYYLIQNAGSSFHIYQYALLLDACPACGRPGGTGAHGAPDPRRAGGGEHVCVDCARWLSRLPDEIHRRKFFSAITEISKRNEKGTIYYCTVCGINPVDAEDGFDTCLDCIKAERYSRRRQ